MSSFFNGFLKSKLAIGFAVMAIVACSNQEFAGGADAAAVPVKKKPLPPITPITPTKIDGPTTGTEIKTDDGGTITQKDCADGKAVEDPNAAFAKTLTLRAGDDISGFINGFNRYTRVNVGAMYFDANTAKFVCQLHGFVGGVATEQGSFRSPDNNNIYRWEPTTKKLLQANAGGSGNRTIKAYSCKGKLKDPCKKDQGWIFQQLP
jgi:hypothetical protein